MKTLAAITTVLALLAIAPAARADSAADAQATYRDIEKTLGVVPTFMKAFPDEGIAAAWAEMKSQELNPKTALSAKNKELIGLAVAAQIPCRYCIYFHTQFARLNGASDREIKEAIAMAAITRHWSTVLNGEQTDLAGFKKEVGQILDHVANAGDRDEDAKAISVTDSASAYQDMKQTLGLVPTFLKAFPATGIAAAWLEMKTVQMNPETALSNKTKELIGLAVAAQVPCTYCTYFHTEFAKANGATEKEIADAVAMSAMTRHWSTVLNGSLIDEKQFRKEVDGIVKHVKPKKEARK
jgi:AhpD family alkylhydroperoxidase